MATKNAYFLRYTDRGCIIGGKRYSRIPVLMDRGGLVVEVVSDWLRETFVNAEPSPNSMKTYGEVLQQFWCYLDLKKRAWDTVDDEFLRAWRDAQDEGRPSRGTINYRLRLVFSFYRWASSHGWLTEDYVSTSDLVVDGRRVPPRIRAVESKAGKHPWNRGVSLVPSMLYKNPGTARHKHTPTSDEVERVFTALRRQVKMPELRDRNVLMGEWAYEAGLRRGEFSSLLVHQISTEHMAKWEAEIAELRRRGEPEKEFIITLRRTKGKGSRRVPVRFSLLKKTYDFINLSRADLVAKLKEKDPSFKEPPHVFFTERGEPLKPNTISKLIKKALKEAGVDAWPHRLRASYATEVFEALYLAEREKPGGFDTETLLLRVAERMGHTNPDSLRPYLVAVQRKYAASDLELQDILDDRRTAAEARRNAKRIKNILGTGDLRERLQDLAPELDSILEKLFIMAGDDV